MTESEHESRRRTNHALWRRCVAAQCARNKEEWLATLSDDIVFEAPGYGVRRAGRPAMANVFDGMLERFSRIHYEFLRFIPALDPDLVIAEEIGDNIVSGSNAPYQNRYLFLVTCFGGRINHILEYSNPQVLVDALRLA